MRCFRWFVLGCVFLSLLPAGSASNSAAPKSPVRTVRRGDPWINLRDGEELEAALAPAAPLALAFADFDEDGVPDLVAGYASESLGVLGLWTGSGGRPYFSPSRKFELPEEPELVGAGDFDGDGHADLVAVARGSSSLYLLSGDGRGGLGSLRRIELPGRATALASGDVDLPDGLIDLVVGIEGSEGPRLLVFESPGGALRGVPESSPLPAPATAIALGRKIRRGGVEGVPARPIQNGWPARGGAPAAGPESQPKVDALTDLIVAAGRHLIVIEGRDRKLSLDSTRRSLVGAPAIHERSFPFGIRSLAVGEFSGRGRTELALLSEEGVVIRLEEGDRTEESARSAGDRWHLDRWESVELSRMDAAQPLAAAARIFPARVSSLPGDALVVTGTADGTVAILTSRPESLTASIQVDQGVAAILPLRLNGDALDDLVILRHGVVAPVVATTAPESTFVVTSTSNSGAGTFRDALTQANASPGADMITFNISGLGRTLTPASAFPMITEAVTIDATTNPGYTGRPVITLNGSSAGSGVSGLRIAAPNCLVRGLAIVAFSNNGILIQGAGAIGNVVRNCHIGVVALGTTASANGDDGIEISGGAHATIGGTVASARNVISGNRWDGIFIDGLGGSGNNVIQGNYIGTNAAGTDALPNGNLGGGAIFHGIEIARLTTGNLVGGTDPGAGNLISGNAGFGVGIFNEGTSGNLVQGNLIGTDASGTLAIANGALTFGAAGAAILNPPGGLAAGPESNLIGGTTAAARNVISGNSTTDANQSGVLVRDSGTKNNLVQGNHVGLNGAGNAALPNVSGVVIAADAPNNTIGGVSAGAGNVVSGQGTGWGVGIFGLESSGNVVQGNFVGTNPAGTSSIANYTGVVVSFGAHDTLIGGSEAGAGNLVSGNINDGVDLDGSNGSDLTVNRVEGNLIGTNAAGTATVPNAHEGVELFASARGNVVIGNLISGNERGVRIRDAGTQLNVIQNNRIGTQIDGSSPLGNTLEGVFLDSSAGGDNSIGGTAAGAGNVIAFNGGIGVSAASGTGEAIRGNSIFANGGLGIDLAPPGPTANDACDGDTGPNNLQNFPVLTSAVTTGSFTGVQGTLDSTASTTFTLDFYASSSCDPSGNGEGQTYLGSSTVMTDGACGGTFNVVFPLSIAAGQAVTATATGPGGVAGSTSEFSSCATAAVGCIVPFEVTNLRLLGDKETLVWNSAAGAGPGTVHDVASGVGSELPVGSGASEACVVSNEPGTTTSSSARPSTGQWFWYLVRGRNACGSGSYGSRSNGAPRTTNVCP